MRPRYDISFRIILRTNVLIIYYRVYSSGPMSCLSRVIRTGLKTCLSTWNSIINRKLSGEANTRVFTEYKLIQGHVENQFMRA